MQSASTSSEVFSTLSVSLPLLGSLSIIEISLPQAAQVENGSGVCGTTVTCLKFPSKISTLRIVDSTRD